MADRAENGGQKESLESEAVIIATGFGSPLPKDLGIGKINDFVIGAQAEVEVNSIDEVEVYIDHEMAPGGFAWLIPTQGNKGLAGLMTSWQPKQCLERLLSHLKALNKINSADVASSYGAIPLRTLPRTYAERILVVGEAAGQVKPTTGGGVFYGMMGADLAAETAAGCLRSGDCSEQALSEYALGWRTLMEREMSVVQACRGRLARLSDGQIDRFFALVSRNGLLRWISNHAAFDWHAETLLRLLEVKLADKRTA